MVTYLVEAEVARRDSGSIENPPQPRTLLGGEMAYQLPDRLEGAPFRLPIENQARFEAVTRTKAIEFVEGVGAIHKGEGGYAEDHEYFGELASI